MCAYILVVVAMVICMCVCVTGEPEYSHYERAPEGAEQSTNLYDQPSDISGKNANEYEVPMVSYKGDK